MIYQLKITLSDSKPPIWRRIEVDGFISLGQLHWVIQLVMGWTNSHLHHFIVDGTYYGMCDPDFSDWGDMETLDEEKFTLQNIASDVGSKFIYEYDFGDSWEHLVLVEAIKEPEAGVFYPRCLKGKRSCPPEDVGGIWGYYGFLEALQDKDHPEHESYVEWIGSVFDPEYFPLETINQLLAQLDFYKMDKRKEALSYTPKQGQYLAFIYYYTKLNGYPPAQADIQGYFGITGPAVNSMLKMLEKQGFISRVAHQARSIKLLLRREELPDLE
jgi:hypothetical protein